MNDLIAFYKQKLNLEDSIFLPIIHEDAMVAIVYKVIQPDGTSLILKIFTRPEDYLREVYFLDYFSNQLPVPSIIAVVPPEIRVNGAILMEYLSGDLLKVTEITHKLAYKLGELLATIHLNRVVGYGDLTQPESLSSDPKPYFAIKLEEGFEECSSHLSKELLEKCRKYLKANINLLNSVDGPCIIHRDFRPGNIIVNNGKISGIIDWSSGRASFTEEDFCTLEHGLWSSNSTSKKPFLAGYATIRSIPNYNTIMPLLRMSRAIGIIGFTVKRNTWANINARIYHFNRNFLEILFK
jgi:tRNA A-37 threonylcarbamoyl transferase component Bud32